MEVNLVLSGGGARGFAHIGVIKALLESGIHFSAISGTSSGALIAALFCDGYSPDEITEICREALPLTHINIHFTQSLLSNSSMRSLLEKYLKNKTFEELPLPLFVSLTDLDTGKQVVVNKGNLIETLIASASVPILFSPAKIEGKYYVDGGMSNNLPVEPFIDSDLKTIGVHVNPVSPYNSSLSMLQQFERVVHLGIYGNVVRSTRNVDLLIEPEELKDYSLFDTKKIDQIIRIGYGYVKLHVNTDVLKTTSVG